MVGVEGKVDEDVGLVELGLEPGDRVVHDAEAALQDGGVVVGGIDRDVVLAAGRFQAAVETAGVDPLADQPAAGRARRADLVHQRGVGREGVLEFRLRPLKQQVPGLGDGVPRLQEAGNAFRVDAVDIEADQDVVAAALDEIQREGVDQAAVHEGVAAPLDGAEHRRDGDGGADGGEERAFAEDDRLAGEEVARHGGERDRQVFDADVRDALLDRADDLVALDEGIAAEREIHQRDHLDGVEAEEPFLEGLEAAGGEDAADQRAGGRAGHGGDAVATFLEDFDGTDVGESTRTAAGEGKGNVLHNTNLLIFVEITH